jgi:hypothetical protein
MQTIYILKATFMSFPKTMVDPMFGSSAQAGKIVEASKSPLFLSKNIFYFNLLALPLTGTCSNFQDTSMLCF